MNNTEFWGNHFAMAARDLLLVTSRSFDERTRLVPSLLAQAGGQGRRDVIALAYEDSGPVAASTLRVEAEANLKTISRLGALEIKELRMRSSDGRRIASREALEVFTSSQQIAEYTDIVVDVSGMPRAVFFPLIARLLHLVDSQERRPNLFVTVAEDSSADAAIHATGIEELADYLPTFTGSLDQESLSRLPRIWFPILGESRKTQLERIYDLVRPKQICPVLPSPAANPRRADDLVREYREFLFGQLELDPRDFMYVAERNPFEVYRQLRQAVLMYRRALQGIGGCHVAFSALSSKLTSLGALLTAYELRSEGIKVGVAHVESQGYERTTYKADSEVVSLWLAGECYE